MGAMPRPLQDDELATTMDIYGLASPRAGVFVGVGTEGSLWRSEDGGRSWRVGRLRTRATLSAVAFRGLDGYIVGEAGILFATRDGGISWRRVRLGTDWDLDAVCLAGDAVQYVAGEGGRLFKTIDEGRTWAALPAPAVKRLTAMAFRDQRLGYAVGTGGVIPHVLGDPVHERPGRLYLRGRWHGCKDDDGGRSAHRPLAALDAARPRVVRPAPGTLLPR